MKTLEKHYLHHLAPGFDRSAVLEDMMTEFGEDIWNFAYFLTRRRDAADDIAQEVFLTVYNRMYTFRGEASVKSWLLSIARNKSLNYLRNAFIRRAVLMGTYRAEGSTASAEQVVFERMSSREVWATVMKLPRKHREVLLLAYHYQMKMDEIAATLDLSEGTVKSRLFRAKKKMSEWLKEEQEGGKDDG
ncbi:RNA polymerase sigma factor [Paenibacillus sp. NPDC057967]|uniref:RNA polymerase sigma factor n=1 Tax=Paenibacillus sp. NPDC057967 TaxID=3346293 RepID=UPI0036DC1FC1